MTTGDAVGELVGVAGVILGAAAVAGLVGLGIGTIIGRMFDRILGRAVGDGSTYRDVEEAFGRGSPALVFLWMASNRRKVLRWCALSAAGCATTVALGYLLDAFGIAA